MGLYQKYRPSSLDEVFGNVSLVSTLKKKLKENTLPQAILLQGPYGCGKTSIARVLGAELGCADIIEVDAAQFRSIDTVRDLTKKTKFTALDGNAKVFILDEIQKMQDLPQTALLKVLEDTPPNTYFFICTTHPQKLIPTIKSRCMEFAVELLNDADMGSLLEYILESEEVSIEENVLNLIVRSAAGHPRDAIQLLEKVIATPKKERKNVAETYQAEEAQKIDLCRLLMPYKGNTGWMQIAKVLTSFKEQGTEPETIRRTVLDYAAAVLLKADNPKAGLVLEIFAENWFDSGFTSLVSSCYTVIKS